jgi:hypothetical protein
MRKELAMTTCSTPRSSRKTTFVTFIAVLSAIALSCNALSGLMPTAGEEAGEEAGEQGAGQGAAPLDAGKAPAVMGFVLDPDGAPVAYAAVGDEIADRNGIVSGDLPTSASGWLEVKTLGSATGYAMPGGPIGETASFEARLTPFDAFMYLTSEEEVVFTLGDAAQPVAEVSIPAGAVSTLPAFVEAATYDLVDVGPYLAELSSGEEMDLEFAVALEASSDSGDPIALAAGKSITVTVFPNPTLPASPTLAVFDAQAGVWQVREAGCTPAEAGGVVCSVPQFAPLIGLFSPHADSTAFSPSDAEAFASMSPAGKGLYRPTPTDEDQAYKVAMIEVANWIEAGEMQFGEGEMPSAEWDAGMTSRLEKLADAAEAYAAIHPDASGISHLLRAAEPAMTTDNQPIADRLVEKAQATAEGMADELLKESDCGRAVEMLNVAQLILLLGGSQAKADALVQKFEKMGECDQWFGTIEIGFPLAGSQPGLDEWAKESGSQRWSENHKVVMTTNVSTFVLKGEDTVKLDFGEVMYGKKDRHGCHNYMTHAGQGGNLVLKFDGRYDGYAFTVGDLQPEGGSASITYGAHGENWDSEAEECVTIGDVAPSAPNYTTVLSHGFSGSPPITIQEILGQADSNDSFRGSEEISNDAFELGIFPSEGGTVRWRFWHTQKYLPVKK